ncbi:MAG: biotin transporter BioY [Candidatus Cloacimonetes bacterium]|nr:biotin transporter BioY [Candidatus Cloacimonadota bacterium]
MTHSTYADIFLPHKKVHSLFYNIALVIAGSLLLTISAKFSFPIPFSPVPVTLQTLAVLLIGTLLGSKRGSITVLFYLSQGIMGLPVFAKGGAGFAYLLGPTGGYLVGFVFAAFLAGFLAEKGWDRSFAKTALAMTLGTIVIFIFGIGWLSVFVGINKAVLLGLMPFIIGEVFKILIADALLPSGWKILEKLR